MREKAGLLFTSEKKPGPTLSRSHWPCNHHLKTTANNHLPGGGGAVLMIRVRKEKEGGSGRVSEWNVTMETPPVRRDVAGTWVGGGR